MCSKRWAKPVRPLRSSFEPTWYQTWTLTTGRELSGASTTCRPFSSVWDSILSWGGVTSGRAAGAWPDSVIASRRPSVLIAHLSSSEPELKPRPTSYRTGNRATGQPDNRTLIYSMSRFSRGAFRRRSTSGRSRNSSAGTSRRRPMRLLVPPALVFDERAATSRRSPWLSGSRRDGGRPGACPPLLPCRCRRTAGPAALRPLRCSR